MFLKSRPYINDISTTAVTNKGMFVELSATGTTGDGVTRSNVGYHLSLSSAAGHANSVTRNFGALITCAGSTTGNNNQNNSQTWNGTSWQGGGGGLFQQIGNFTGGAINSGHSNYYYFLRYTILYLLHSDMKPL